MRIFKNLYQYRELLKTSVKKEVRGKYKNSFLGVIWSFLNPLLQLGVYALVFPLIIKSNETNYTVFFFFFLIPWNFFATAVNRSSFTMVENSNILKKVYFPREILPISVVTSEAVNFIISTVIIIGFVLGFGLSITKYALLYPLILLVQYTLLIGIAFIVSSLVVYIRDLQHFIGVFIQLMFYATPIAYNAKVIPENYQWIMRFNPMATIISGFRDIFYYQHMPDLQALFTLFCIGLALCCVGYAIFSKLQKGFAEQL